MEHHHLHGSPHSDHPREGRQNGGHYYYDDHHNPISGHVQTHVAAHQPPHFTEGQSPPVSPYAMYGRPPQPHEWMEQIQGSQPQGPAKRPNSLMMHFYDENGQIDLPKMLSTVNQLASTFQQVTPVIQQIGSLVRLIR